MKFLDLNGLKHLLTKIKASFGIAIVNNSDYKTELDNEKHIKIPFVANHQIVKMDYKDHINVYNWLQGASKGGILEIVFAGAGGGSTYCRSKDGKNFMYKMILSSSVPTLKSMDFLPTAYNTYTRLIKTDDNKLIVAMFVQNQSIKAL